MDYKKMTETRQSCRAFDPVRTPDRAVLTQMSMKAAEAQLPSDRFMRVHRSFIVGLRHIAAFDRSSLTVASSTIPVGDTFRARFLEAMER